MADVPQSSSPALGLAAWLRRHAALGAALLLTVGLYARVVSFPFVNWDDPLHVYRNPAVVAPQSLSASERWLPRHLGYPMPLTIASYRLERALWVSGARPTLQDGRGFHLTNLLLALLLVVAVYALAARLLADRLAVATATLLFVSHPLLVEPVCWISARKDLLMALGVLAALHAWSSLLSSGRARWLLLFLLAAIAALASKPTAVALVPLCLYLAVVERRRWPAGRPRWPAVLGLAVLAALALVLAVISWQWNYAVGGVQAPSGVGAVLRRTVWGLGFHLSLVFAPLALRPKYIVAPGAFSGFDVLGLAAAAGLGYLLWRKRSEPGAVPVGAALFVSAYLPVSSLLPLTRYIADSYLLLPLVGLALLAGAGLCWLRRHATAYFFRALLALALLLGVALTLISVRQTAIWSSAPRLWRYQQAHHGNSPKVCRMLGQAYNEVGEQQRALATYRRCARRFGPALFENNLALTYYFLGRLDRAEYHFRRILARKPGDRRARKYLRVIAGRRGGRRD